MQAEWKLQWGFEWSKGGVDVAADDNFCTFPKTESLPLLAATGQVCEAVKVSRIWNSLKSTTKCNTVNTFEERLQRCARLSPFVMANADLQFVLHVSYFCWHYAWTYVNKGHVVPLIFPSHARNGCKTKERCLGKSASWYSGGLHLNQQWGATTDGLWVPAGGWAVVVPRKEGQEAPL